MKREWPRKIGAGVETPDTQMGTVCQIDDDGSVWVMWGDNNRKKYTADEVKTFITGRRYPA